MTAAGIGVLAVLVLMLLAALTGWAVWHWRDRRRWDREDAELERQADLELTIEADTSAWDEAFTRAITPPTVSVVSWAANDHDIMADLRAARELIAKEPFEYRLEEYICPWCPTIAQGSWSLYRHIEDAHPRTYAVLLAEADR